MKTDVFHYGKLVENALRSVMVEALQITAKHGLANKHHFYVTFRTCHPGVKISKKLRERYPDKMTIVIQNQFWNLSVERKEFSISLSFSGIRESLIIPFTSVVSFADPSVEFSLQFDDCSKKLIIVPSADTSPKTSEFQRSKSLGDTGSHGSAEIVQLDSRRKKK